MKVLSITPACATNKRANFGARFIATPAAIKLIRENNQYIGWMENNFKLTQSLNEQIGQTIYETALEFAKRKPEKLSVVLRKLPNDNLALSTRPVVYKLDKNNNLIECMREIPYTPQRISRLKDEALALLKEVTTNKSVKRIPLK